MLVKINDYVINTQNVTIIKDIGNGVIEVYFRSGYVDYIKLKIKMDDLVNILGVIENG